MEEKRRYTPRELAVLSLCRLEREGKYGSLEADAAIKKFGLKDKDRALYTKLFYGTLERRLTLDYAISAVSDKPVDEMTLEMKNILRVSAYQLLYLDRIPDYSAVNEGAELAKKYERKSAAGFANAVLRRIAKNGMPEISRRSGDAKYLSVKYSVSEQICGLYLSELGFDETESMLKAFFKSDRLTLRVNTLKTDVDGFISLLSDNGIKAERITQSEFGVKLCEHVDINTLFDIAGDLAFVEDGACQAATVLLGAKPGMTVADVCAAPGGKSLSTAMEMKNDGVIYAYDIHENKLKAVDKSAARLGVTIIKTEKRDGRTPPDGLAGKCDRVICDVPCSGLGVLGSKPDMRYKEITELERLINTQRAILRSSSAYLKKGGVMVYSTCTVLSAENGGNVRDFLQNNPDFELISEKTYLPHRDGTDGFYTAKIIRK